MTDRERLEATEHELMQVLEHMIEQRQSNSATTTYELILATLRNVQRHLAAQYAALDADADAHDPCGPCCAGKLCGC